MKKKEQFNLALWDRLKKDNIPHAFESRSGRKISPITKYDELHQPIIGVDLTDKDLIQWSIDGVCFKDGNKSGLDLFIVWEEEQLKDNVFKAYMAIMKYDGLAMTFPTLEIAKETVGKNAIAIIPVSIPYTKGEGLNNPKSN